MMDKYKREMSSLKKIKAPDDFLGQVNARIERRFSYDRIIKTLFFPLQIKVPLELASVVAVLIVSFYAYQGAQAPVEMAYEKAPAMKMSQIESRAGRSALRTKKTAIAAPAPVIAAKAVSPAPERPIEIAISLNQGVEESKQKADASMDTETRASVMGAGVKGDKAPAAQLESDGLSVVEQVVRRAQGRIISKDNESITAEISADNYAGLLSGLKKLGTVRSPVISGIQPNNKLVTLHIKITP
jgi:hypothetical protein